MAASMPSAGAFLDCRFYPHVWDKILKNSTFNTKLVLRQCCSALRDHVDCSLSKTSLMLDVYSRQGVQAYASEFGGVKEKLPFFHVKGNTRSQIRAVQRAKSIHLMTSSSAWLNKSSAMLHSIPWSTSDTPAD